MLLQRDGKLALEALHWQRLFAGMELLGFVRSSRQDEAFFRKQVFNLMNKNKTLGPAIVRLQVYAGTEGLLDEQDLKIKFVLEMYPLAENYDLLNANGLQLGIARGLVKAQDRLSPLKSGAALLYAEAAREAKSQRWNDALICNAAGYIVESSRANIFWIEGGKVYTPPLTEGCVAGVMRAHILETLNRTKERVAEEPLSPPKT